MEIHNTELGIWMQQILCQRGDDPQGTPIWNRQGCSSEILDLTPKGDHLGVVQAFCDP